MCHLAESAGIFCALDHTSKREEREAQDASMTHGGNLSPEFLCGCEDNGGLTQSGPAELESTLDSITFFFPTSLCQGLKKRNKKGNK